MGAAAPQRVLLVSEQALRGGAETSTVLLGEALRERGSRVSVAFGWRGEMLDEARRAGLRLPLGTGAAVPGRARLREPGMLLAAARGHDVVHLSALEDRSVHAGRVALAAGRPTVAHLRSPWQVDRAALLHARGASVVTNSTATERLLRARGCERVTFVPNGIDGTALRRSAARDPAVLAAGRRELGLPDDAVVVLCVANMAPYKGLDAMVPGVVEAMRRDPRVHLVHVGAAHFTSTQSVRSTVQTLVDASGAGSRFHLLGSRADIAELTSLADIALVPSTGEGTARAILEAWSAAKPVVAARADGLVDLVDGETNGLLVDLDDPMSVADGICALASNPSLADRLARTGQSAAAGPYSHDAHVERILEVYARATSARVRR